MAEVDRRLLERTGKRRPRVALLPTAAGHEDPRQWTDIGAAHFAALGAEPVAVMAIDRASCDDLRWAEEVERSDLIYFSGGKPGYLVECLRNSAVWHAALARHEAGAVLAGSSAGAMMLGARTFTPDDFDERGVPRRMGITEAFALLTGYMVIPHFDLLTRMDNQAARDINAIFMKLIPEDARVLGIDEDTALLRLDGNWCVAGKGSAHLLRGTRIESSFPSGAVVPEFF